jgi:DNA-binding FadR family transcriptional regulator
MRVWLHHVARPANATERQDEVVAAIRTGNAEHAEAVMREHVMRTAPRLAEFLRNRDRLQAGVPAPLRAGAPA